MSGYTLKPTKKWLLLLLLCVSKMLSRIHCDPLLILAHSYFECLATLTYVTSISLNLLFSSIDLKCNGFVLLHIKKGLSFLFLTKSRHVVLHKGHLSTLVEKWFGKPFSSKLLRNYQKMKKWKEESSDSPI